MDTAARNSQFLDADAFLRTEHSEFRNAGRYELVLDRTIAHTTPTPEPGVIPDDLAREIGTHLRSHPECRQKVASDAMPHYQQRDTARIPNAMVYCGQYPRVLFEVVSPSEVPDNRRRDPRQSDLQVVEGVRSSWDSSKTAYWRMLSSGGTQSGGLRRLWDPRVVRERVSPLTENRDGRSLGKP